MAEDGTFDPTADPDPATAETDDSTPFLDPDGIAIGGSE